MAEPLSLAAGMQGAAGDGYRTVSMSISDGVDMSFGRCRCEFRPTLIVHDGHSDRQTPAAQPLATPPTTRKGTMAMAGRNAGAARGLS